jgi:hypothetical protein
VTVSVRSVSFAVEESDCEPLVGGAAVVASLGEAVSSAADVDASVAMAVGVAGLDGPEQPARRTHRTSTAATVRRIVTMH